MIIDLMPGKVEKLIDLTSRLEEKWVWRANQCRKNQSDEEG